MPTKGDRRRRGIYQELCRAEGPVMAKDLAQLLCCQAQLMAQLPIDDPYAYTDLVCKLVK